MKILVINNSAIYCQKGEMNVFKTTGEFGAELLKLGNKVEFFQLCYKVEDSFYEFNLLSHGINVTVSKRYQLKLITYLLAYIQGLYRILQNDFIYIFYPNSFRYLAFFAIIFGKRYGLNVRGEKSVDSKISKFLYKYAECVFTVSPKFAQIVDSLGGNSFDYKPAISFTHEDCVMNRVYSAKECYLILYLGRIDRDKGLFELLEAIKKLKQENTCKFLVKIVGSGEDFDALRMRTKELDILEEVKCLGAILDLELIKKLYTDADIFILPTHHEGFPRTLYEAMIFGTPIITTFVGGIPSIMRDGFNCYQIELKSVESIYKKLLYVMLNYPMVSEIAKRGTETVKEILNTTRLSQAQHLNKIINGK